MDHSSKLTLGSMYSGNYPYGMTASTIFRTTPSSSLYQVNIPVTASLMNFIPSFGGLSSPGLRADETHNDVEEVSSDILNLQFDKDEDEKCKGYWRAFKDIAGPWTSHRFDMYYWNSPRRKSKAEFAEKEVDALISNNVETFDGILTKKMIIGNLSKLDRCPEFFYYAYTKCVLINKNLTNIDVIKDYKYIQYLDISHNKLQCLKPLGNLPFLKILDASHNQLITVLDFKAPFFLTVVNLSHNRFISLRDLTAFWSITDMNLSFNMIRSIDGLKGLRYLTSLNLSHNRIEVIENLTHLRIQFLYLQNNVIKISEDNIADKTKLRTLKNLRIINLSYNQISTLKMFEKVENLEFLDIVNNNISKLTDVYYLRKLKYLNRLNLTGNPVTNIRRYVEVCVRNIKKLIILDNEQINSNYWLERLSEDFNNVSQNAAHNRLKLMALEQMKPPQICAWLPPYDSPPIAVINLVGLEAFRRAYIASKFCETNKNVVVGIPYTTKLKHPSEVEGKHFYYVSEEKFKTMLKNGEFLTYQESLGTCYGIAHKEFEKAKNKIILFYTDLTMALALKRKFLNTVLILSLPSSREAHLEKLNILYAVQVFEDGTMKVINSPAIVAQCNREYSKERRKKTSFHAQAMVNEIVEKATSSGLDEENYLFGDTPIISYSSANNNNNNSEDEEYEEELEGRPIDEVEKSEIFQLWCSTSSPHRERSVVIKPEDTEDAEKIKRYVSFTVAHVHKIYDETLSKTPTASKIGNNATKESTISVKTLNDAVNNPNPNLNPVFTTFPILSKSCVSESYAELLARDHRIKSLFDEELRKREELLELHLDMPGLFRELLFTDEETDTMHKLGHLVKEIMKYDKTTKKSILSFTNDKSVNTIIASKLSNCFTELKKDVYISEKLAGEFAQYGAHICKEIDCFNINCPEWK